jgi:hypothetical protein
MNSSVKQNCSWERNFCGTVQNSAYDLQKLYTKRFYIHVSLKKSADKNSCSLISHYWLFWEMKVSTGSKKQRRQKAWSESVPAFHC